MNPHVAANRANWNDRVPIHRRNATGFYGIDRLTAGGLTLDALELDLLGEVAGRRVLHMQCHFGLGTLSLARLGAQATGLDFSPAAIAAARDLSQATGLRADFVEAEATRAREAVTGLFDIVFASWGVFCWIPDLGAWMAAAGCLAPGGRLAVIDHHPLLPLLNQEDGRLVLTGNWRTPPDRPLHYDDATTYTGAPDLLTHRDTYEWHHPLGEFVATALAAGLTIERLEEHERLAWPWFPEMAADREGLYALPEGWPRLPLAFSLAARKPVRSPSGSSSA
ncbi:MAG: class I SAM-dependent methyltransferase [Thalassobaculales bacterium]